MNEYRYVTIFETAAERAKNWLQDHVNKVTCTVDNNIYIIEYTGTIQDYNAFCDYMQFLYAV